MAPEGGAGGGGAGAAGSGPRARRAAALRLALLFLLVVACYAPSVRNGFVYDDYRLIVPVEAPDSAAAFAHVFSEAYWPTLPYYRPVARLTFGVQKLLHGDRPALYHLFNVLAMGVTSLVAYGLLCTPALGIPTGAAWLGAALFALHPVASSTVHPITGRETLLLACLSIGAVAAFLRPGPRWYALSLVLLAGALLTKEQAVVVPGILVLADLLGLSAGAPGRRPAAWARRFLPIFLLVAAYLVVRRLALGGAEPPRVAAWDHPTGPLHSLYYTCQTTLLPYVQLVYEPRDVVWNTGWRRAVWPWLVLLLAFGCYRLWPRVGRRVLFWLGWILCSGLLTSNFLQQEARFAERYGFLALLGFVGIVATLASATWQTPRGRRAWLVGGAVVLAACAAISATRARFYADHATFLEQWLHTDPGNGQAQLAMGSQLRRKGDVDGAERHYRLALEIAPRNALVLQTLGGLLRQRGDLDGAEAVFERAVAFHPNSGRARFDLGSLCLERGDLACALENLEAAARLEPGIMRTHLSLGEALLAAGRPEDALASIERARALAPRQPEVHEALAEALEALGRGDEARARGGGAAPTGPR